MTSLGAPAPAQSAVRAARRGADSPWLARLARVGLVARGLVYVLVALLAAQIAFGDHSRSADQEGAFRALAESGLGRTLLWLVVVGFVGYALWQLSEAAFGHHAAGSGAKRTAKRLESLAKVALYGLLAVLAARTAVGARRGRGSEGVTAELLSRSGGRVAVVLAGLALVAIAGFLTWKGLRTTFEEELELHRLSPTGRRAVERLGQVGYVARGVVFAAVGLFVVAAAVTFDPAKARGLDLALTELAAQPYGKWLLLLVALGLLCFGAYSLVESRYRRV